MPSHEEGSHSTPDHQSNFSQPDLGPSGLDAEASEVYPHFVSEQTVVFPTDSGELQDDWVVLKQVLETGQVTIKRGMVEKEVPARALQAIQTRYESEYEGDSAFPGIFPNPRPESPEDL
jgi:hypothetical protein